MIWGVTATDPVTGLVINEIMKDPVSVTDTHGEFIELYNPNSFDVEINDWAIKDLGSDYHVLSSTEPLIIESFSYFVLARDTSTATNGGFTADYEYSSFTLSNGSDEVILVNPSGVEVDGVGYDSTDFPDLAGCTLELRNPSFNNIHGYNWYAAATPYGAGDFGTPGAENSMWEDYKEMTLDVDIDSLVVPLGGSMQIDFDLTAQSDGPVEVVLFCELYMPDGYPFIYNPLFGPAYLSFETEERWEKVLRLVVPMVAELGDYELVGYLQNEAGTEIDRETVIIRVVEAEGQIEPGIMSWRY
jgi:hypothetical protein